MRDHYCAVPAGYVPPLVLAYDIETISTAEQPDGAFPPWPTHRVVAVGYASAERRDGNWVIDLNAAVGAVPDDPALIEEVDRRLAAAEVVTTLNGRGFDALVLRLAAQRQRLFGLKALAAHASAKKFGPEHADLSELYSSFGRKVGLADLCCELGIPAKTSTNGGEVAALWAAGEHERIRHYVLEDAVATLCAWFCWSAARAGDEALVTRPMATLARCIEANPALAHLQPFLDCELMRWSRPRAMRADIAAALARTQQKLRQEEDERSFVPCNPVPIRSL